MIRVVLADDHEVVRTGIRLLLDTDPDIAVVAEAAEGTEAYSLVAREKPDVLLLDISMPPGQSGLVACERTAKDFPDTKVVILTMFAEPEQENPQAEQARRVIDEECTESQQDFFFEHFGKGTPLEEMRQAEAEQTGKLPSSATMTNRKNKIIDKVAKSFRVERVKRHKYPKKD